MKNDNDNDNDNNDNDENDGIHRTNNRKNRKKKSSFRSDFIRKTKEIGIANKSSENHTF